MNIIENPNIPKRDNTNCADKETDTYEPDQRRPNNNRKSYLFRIGPFPYLRNYPGQHRTGKPPVHGCKAVINHWDQFHLDPSSKRSLLHETTILFSYHNLSKFKSLDTQQSEPSCLSLVFNKAGRKSRFYIRESVLICI